MMQFQPTSSTSCRCRLALLCMTLGFVCSVKASVEWTTSWPVINITQGFAQSSLSGTVSAGLCSSNGANCNGSDRNYRVTADQLYQTSFLLVNIADSNDTINMTLTYDDGLGNSSSLSENTASGIFTGDSNGATPQITASFTVAGFWGSSAWGNTYAAVIDVCAHQPASCGGGGGNNPDSASSNLYILFRGTFAGGGVSIISGLDSQITLTDQGANWSATDDFCVGVAPFPGNVQLTASSTTGAGVFQMSSGANTLDYTVSIEGIAMTEGGGQSFAGQTLSDCSSGNNGFTLQTEVSNAAVGGAAPGVYSDTLVLTVQPL